MPPALGLLSSSEPLDPAFVERARGARIGRAALSTNYFLDHQTWLTLARSHDPGWSGVYLRKNLTLRRARYLLGPLSYLLGPDTPLKAYDLAELDEQIAGLLLRRELVDDRIAIKARALQRPWLATAVLRSALVSAELQRQVAPFAFSADRLAWLVHPARRTLSDDEAWAIATGPGELYDCYRLTVFDDHLRRDETLLAPQLLWLRPGLASRAIATGAPVWLLAASCQALTADAQAALCAAEAAMSSGAWDDHTHNRPELRRCGPVANLAAGPWATEATWEFVGSGRALGCHLEAERLLSTDSLGYRRHRLLRDRSELPRTDLSTAPVGEVGAWLEWATWNDALVAPYVAAAVLERRDLGPRLARQRVAILRDAHDAGIALLAHRSRARSLPASPQPAHFCSPDVEKPRTMWPFEASAPMHHLGAEGTGWMAERLDVDELEVALVLAAGGFEGSLESLVDVARALCASPAGVAA